MKYRVSPRADSDLEEICAHIAVDNPRAATRFHKRIHETLRTLAQFPGMGHSRRDVGSDRYLFWPVGKYVVCYRVDRRGLVVVRILHGARDFRSIFEI